MSPEAESENPAMGDVPDVLAAVLQELEPAPNVLPSLELSIPESSTIKEQPQRLLYSR